MLTLLGIATIAALLLLVLFRVTSVLVALTLVPVAAAIIGGFAALAGCGSVGNAHMKLMFKVQRKETPLKISG